MHTLKTTLSLFLLVPLALAACLGRSPTTPPAIARATETAVERPTTLAPTNTALPEPEATVVPVTATPVPEEPAATTSPGRAAVTPTLPPTPDPNEGVGNPLYADPFDGSSGWHWNFSDDVATFGIEGGQLKASMGRADAGWRFSISDDRLRAGDQQVRATARTLSCAGDDEYGLLFRGQAEADNRYSAYVFKLRCDGAAQFEALLGTERTTLVDWTPSPAIQAGPNAENTLTVWMLGDQFRFYVNDQYLFSAQDGRLGEGFYGFYLHDRTDGGLEINFDDLAAQGVALAGN